MSEPLQHHRGNLGWMEVICGSMFSGKSEELIRRLRRAQIAPKTLAICVRCGAPANRTQRLVDSPDRLLVGASGAYEARCRLCFEPPRD